MQIVNNTFLGHCSNCGECCSDILHLDNDEIDKIDNYLKEHNICQANKGENNLRCPFRDDFLKRCTIYEVRPYICREYTCYKFENNIYDKEAFSKIDKSEIKLVDIRHEIFRNKGERK